MSENLNVYEQGVQDLAKAGDSLGTLLVALRETILTKGWSTSEVRICLYQDGSGYVEGDTSRDTVTLLDFNTPAEAVAEMYRIIKVSS